MRIPALGPRGEGWVVAQGVLGLAVIASGVTGPRWPEAVSGALWVGGVAIGAAGLSLFVAGIAALGASLTAFPRPMKGSTLREGRAYRLARHPIYGGLLMVALGWSLARSPLALLASALLLVQLELKSRVEESMLAERYPEYEAYRHRVRWRFVPGVH